MERRRWKSSCRGIDPNNLEMNVGIFVVNSHLICSCFHRGCQNGSVHVWTLPQGGTFVSLPNILNSSQRQDKSTDVKVSLDYSLEPCFATLVLQRSLNCSKIQAYPDYMCQSFI